MMNKARVITDYEKLTDVVKEQIKLTYPYGYSQHLISFMNREGRTIKGLRFETDDRILLIRMTVNQAEKIVENDDDFDEDGNLMKSVKYDYMEKYPDVEDLVQDDDGEEDVDNDRD